MKFCLVILLLSALLFPADILSQGERYQHPAYDFSFEATPNWTESFLDSGTRDYSVVHPNNNMEIRLAYVADCRQPVKYMRRLSGLKGLECQRGGYDTILNDREAVVMKGNFLEGRESYSTMVIGFPMENGLYLMEISCPDNCAGAHRERLKAILKTVRVGPGSSI
ncbi:MAG: hypothetical protein GY790_18620 [Bacteroidetes bacterium]|nr:hypothetical protein [Bacteroidota bacterium]